MKEELKNGIVISVFVIIIILVVYFSTAIFMTGEIGNKKNEDKTTTTTKSDSNEYNNRIISSKIFNRSEDTYIVVIFSNKKASNELKDKVKNYDGDMKLYVVNLDEAMNKSIKSDTDDLYVKEPSSLKVKENALLTISNGTVINAVTGGANIISNLK